MQQQPMRGLLLALLLLACGSCCMAPGARGVLATADSSATAAVHQPRVPHAHAQQLRRAHQQQQQQQQLHGGKHGGSHGGLHGGPHHLQPVTVFLPYCAQLAANLPPADQARLRAKVQQVLHQRLRVRDLVELIAQNENPPTDPKQKAAFKTPKTVAELHLDMTYASGNATELQSQFDALLGRLMASGHLPNNATFSWVSQCLSSRLEPSLFPYRPQVSFLLQYFKRPHIIDRYVERLQAVANDGIPCELLVNVDSITEHDRWSQLAAGNGEPPDKVKFWVVPVLSANVHEARGYNRLAALARGEVLVFMQDDDLPPKDPVWVHGLTMTLRRYPQTAAVGMQSYRYCVHGFNNQYQGDFYFYDSMLLLKMHYAAAVDFAPLAVRRQAFEEVGGLDEGMSDQGVCGIFGDWELSTRLWVAGWHVMFMQVDGREGDGQSGGTHQPETGGRCWQRQAHCAGQTFHRRYDALIPVLCQRVKELNLKKLRVVDASRPCPFGLNQCTLDTPKSDQQQQQSYSGTGGYL